MAAYELDPEGLADTRPLLRDAIFALRAIILECDLATLNGVQEVTHSAVRLSTLKAAVQETEQLWRDYIKLVDDYAAMKLESDLDQQGASIISAEEARSWQSVMIDALMRDVSYQAVAHEQNVSVAYVRKQGQMTGFILKDDKRPRSTRTGVKASIDWDTRIETAVLEGHTAQEIARMYSYSPAYVSKQAKLRGVELPKEFSYKRWMYLFDQLDTGQATLSDMAIRLNISHRRLARRYGEHLSPAVFRI